MSETTEYNARAFHLPKEVVRSLNELDPTRSALALARAWLALILLITGIRTVIPSSSFWFFYVPTIFLIASRYGVLLQLIHEAAHGLLSKNKKVNRFLATWLCSSPIGISFEGYTKGHMRHHAGTNTETDPKSDTEKYRVVDFRKPELYFLFLKDLLGFTALQIFFDYRDYETSPNEPKAPFTHKILALLRMSTCQVIILTVLFQWNLVDYFLLWLVPAISPHMFLMRVRGIAEHGLAKQLEVNVKYPWQGNFYTRSFLTEANQYDFKPFVWIEKLLIGTLNAGHHHEHHLFPTVPFYHLPDLHQRISQEVRRLNPDVYAKGYFAAAFPVQRFSLALQST